MAPELEVLKRVRSKPTDWWAAAPSPSVTTPPAPREHPAKKSGRVSDIGRNGGIQSKPAAGNRRNMNGKGKDGKVEEGNDDGDELEGDGTQKVKPLRRGRSSGEEKEFRGDVTTAASKVDEWKGAKRKNGAASNQWLDEDVGENAKNPPAPRKRGRSAPKQAEEERGQPAASEPTAAKAPSKDPNPPRRGRSSNTEAELQAVNYKEASIRRHGHSTDTEAKVRPVAPSISKADTALRRGRSSNTEVELQASVNYKETKTVKRGRDAEAELPTATSSSPPKAQARQMKRGQRSVPDIEEESAQPAATQSIAFSTRTRQSDGDMQSTSSKLSKGRASSNKPVRPVVKAKPEAVRGGSTAKNQARSKKRGRESEAEDFKVTRHPSSQGKKRRLQDTSQVEIKNPKRKSAKKADTQSHDAKRRRVEKPIQEDRLEKAPTYQHLAAVSRRVSRTTIDAKWDSLPPVCVERISQLLQDIQRPVVVRLNDERRRNQASTALQMISRRLVSKISKGLPFPQGTRNHREDDFDFEKILDHIRALELQLTPALHANELLEAELGKEMALLESEQANLSELETNAKAESVKRKQDGRKLHSLLQSRSTPNKDVETDIGFRVDNISRPLNFNLLEDGDLQDIVKDLQGHVDSIEGNMKQVKGITQAIAKSKAAVQATLFEHLDSTQYEEVVLG